jgi:hypothetical protein
MAKEEDDNTNLTSTTNYFYYLIYLEFIFAISFRVMPDVDI